MTHDRHSFEESKIFFETPSMDIQNGRRIDPFQTQFFHLVLVNVIYRFEFGWLL